MKVPIVSVVCFVFCGFVMGSITLGPELENLAWNHNHHVNHPEDAIMHPTYLKGSKLYMDHTLFERAVQCAKTPDACQDVEQLDQPAERILGGKK